MKNQTKNRHLLCYAFCKSRSIIDYVQLLPSKYLCSDFFTLEARHFLMWNQVLAKKRSFAWLPQDPLSEICSGCVKSGWGEPVEQEHSDPGQCLQDHWLHCLQVDSFTLKSYRWYPTQAGSRAIHGKLCGAAGAGGGGGEQDADGRQPGRAQTCKTPLGGAWTACEDGGIAETTFVRQPAERSDWDCGGTQMRCQETQMSWILNPVKRALKVLRIYESWTVISSKMAID